MFAEGLITLERKESFAEADFDAIRRTTLDFEISLRVGRSLNSEVEVGSIHIDKQATSSEYSWKSTVVVFLYDYLE